MSNFNINTDFNIGDELKVVFDIYNEAPTSTTQKDVYIVDIHEGSPHTDASGNTILPEDATNDMHTMLTMQNSRWSNIHSANESTPDTTDLKAGASSSFDGAFNTNAIINQTGHTDSAAKVANGISRTYSGVTYNDYYLPTRVDLSAMYANRLIIDPTISAQGGSPVTKNSNMAAVVYYWASNESQYETIVPCTSMSFQPSGSGGAYFMRNKQHRFRVRAIRKETTTDSVSVGDFYKGGVVFRIVDGSVSGSFSGVSSASVDLDITVGASNTSIYSQNGLSNPGSGTAELTVTEAMGSSPIFKFVFTNSNAGSYGWGTNVQIFKKIEEVITTVEAGGKTTLAFSDDMQRWTSRYSFLPEYFSTYKTCFASFVNGALYIHDNSNNKNYFYNTTFPSSITYIENVSPSQPKVFLTHAVEGNEKPSHTKFETIENHTMSSDLVADDYIRKEGTFYSDLFGDTNDPNVGDNATFGDKLIKGTKLRGQYIQVGMTFRTKDLEIKHSNIGFITSKGHTT